jgi:hypothetical protein
MTRRAIHPAIALALLMLASLALRVGSLKSGYWIDEGIAVGRCSTGAPAPWRRRAPLAPRS